MTITKKETHIKGDWEVVRVEGITVAQGYKCSCGVIGCQQPAMTSGSAQSEAPKET